MTLEDTAASIVEERIVSSESESCNNGNCSIIIISTFRQICGFNVHVVAANEFGSSNMTTTVNGLCAFSLTYVLMYTQRALTQNQVATSIMREAWVSLVCKSLIDAT